MSQSQSQGQGQQIDLTTLSTQQLSQLQSRLSQELEHLTQSYARLRQAQGRFRDCIRAIQEGVQGKGVDTPLLIPLTTSLYVPGRLSSNDRVLVDVGTGFYVEKGTTDARRFYEGKVAELHRSLGEIEKVVGGKEGNLRVVEEVLRAKVMSEQQGQQQGQRGQGEGGG